MTKTSKPLPTAAKNLQCMDTIFKIIAGSKMLRLLIALLTSIIIHASLSIPNCLAETTWQAIGPFTASLRSLAVDQANNQTVYAGIFAGGVFKSSNGGASWKSLNNGLTNKFLRSLAVYFADSRTMYAGTDGGIYKTTDGGASWTLLREDIHAGSLAVDPQNNQVVYAGTNSSGIYKTTDGGGSWSSINNGITPNITNGVLGTIQSLTFHPTNSQTVYATIDGVIYKSSNSGSLWEKTNSDLFFYSLTFDKSNSQIIYAGTTVGIYKSIDGGISWFAANSGMPTSWVVSPVINPTNSQIVYAATPNGLFKTTDGGASWTASNTGMETATSIQYIAIDPVNNETLYAGDFYGDGVFKSVNSGTTWTKINSGLTSANMFNKAIAMSPGNNRILYVGADDGVYKTVNGGESWIAVNNGMNNQAGSSFAIDPIDNDVVYAGTWGVGTLFKTTNGGITWAVSKNGLSGNVSSLAIDQTNHQIIYAGNYDGVYKSNDGGASWVKSVTGPTGNWFKALTMDPDNNQIIYVGSGQSGGISKSNNGGIAWQLANNGLKNTSILSLAIDHDNSQNLFVGTDGGGVYKTTNGGALWTEVNANGLTNYIVRALAIDPIRSNVLYAGTDGGLFKSMNGGTTWVRVIIGTDTSPVNNIVIDSTGNQSIYVGTTGSGVFKTLLSATIPTLTGSDTPTFTIGSLGSFRLASSGWPTPVFSLSGTMPAGMTFDTETGILSGIPAIGTAGIYPLILTATNGIPPDAIRGITLTVLPPTTIAASITSPTVGDKPNSLTSITGNASGSGISKVEVQVSDGTYYLQANGTFSITPAWLTALGTISWSLDTPTVPWREGITYTIQTRASDGTVTSAPSSSTFTIVVPTTKTTTILSMTMTPDSLRAGDKTTISGSLVKADTSAVSGQPVTLIISPPSTVDDPYPEPVITNLATDSNGAFTTGVLSLFTVPGVYMVQARFEGNSTLASSFTYQVLGVTPQSGYAIIVTGKSPDNSLLDMHTASTDTIYDILVNKRGFLPENIQYLKSTTSTPVTKQKLQDAITTWARDNLVASPGPLYIIMIDHGSTNSFIMDTDTLTPNQLKGYLDTLESDSQVIASGALTSHNRIIMIGSCYSGIFAALSKPGRIVITSANTDEQSIAGFSIYNSGSNTTYYGGEYFIDSMFSYLGRGDTLKDAFNQSSNMVKLRDPRKVPPGTHAGVYDTLAQHPLLDDNGDTKASYILDTDGTLAANLHLGVGIRSLGNPADITAVTETTTILATEAGDIPIWLRVNDNSRIAKAWMEIRTPITAVSSSGSSGQVIPRLMTLPLYYDGLQWNGRYNFPNAGKYNILYYTQDNQNNDIAPAKYSVVYRQLTNNTAPADFALTSPNDGDGVNGMFTLTWQEVTSPNKITYTLHVSTDQNFTTEVYKEENIPQAATYMPKGALKNPQTGQYYCQNGDSYCYWKVTAIDNFGAKSESNTRGATIVATNALPGIIKGYVRDATTGIPIAGAIVTAGSSQFTTLANGYFNMDLPGGAYTVTATATGYQTKNLSNIIVTPGQIFDVNVNLEVNSPPSVFNLISPEDEAAPGPIFPLTWQESADPDGLTYTLLVATDQNFTNVVYREEKIPQAATYMPKDALKDPASAATGGYYCQSGDSYCYWKVQAIDSYGAVTESDTRSFTIVPTSAFNGIIIGKIVPPVSGAVIKTDGNGSAISLPNGYFLMSHIAGSFTLTVTAEGYDAYSAALKVGELVVTPANVSLTSTTTPTTTTTFTTTTTTTTTVPQVTTTTTIPTIAETLIDLSAGWNLISSPLEPENSQIHTVFFGIEDQIVSSWKWVKNNWAVCLPGYDDDGAEYADQKGFSLLGELHAGEGFWVNASNSQYLAISGTQPSDSSISLSSGWNLVGLKSSSAKSVKDLISGNEAKIASIWKWENNTWAVYLPGEADGGADYAAGKGFGVLSNIEPGEGFWLNATQAVVLP